MPWVCWSWSVQPMQAGKAEIGLVAASEPQGWDLQGETCTAPCQGTALICSGASLTWQRLSCFCLG